MFETFQVLVKSSSGFNTVPGGMVTSVTKARLLQPYASVSMLTVGVKIVPVTLGVNVGVIVPRVGTYTRYVEVAEAAVGIEIVFMGAGVVEGSETAGTAKAVRV
jgi:hypothetical protein